MQVGEKRYFECTVGGASKWWSIELRQVAGSRPVWTLFSNHGKIGKPSAKETFVYSSYSSTDGSLTYSAEKKIREKINKGYMEVKVPAKPVVVETKKSEPDHFLLEIF